MKMQSEHFEQLRLMLEQVAARNGKTFSEIGESFERAGFTNKRCRWDIFWAIPNPDRREWFSVNGIYDYLDDSHIDTALRKITGLV